MSDEPWRARLARVCATHGLDVGAAQRLAALLVLVRDEPTAPTTVRDPLEGVSTHVADSLDGLEVADLAAARTIADLGSGAGFPGLVLAVALPGAEITLVESLGRKCAFLERAATACACRNVTVACDRAETWPGRGVDAVTARAVAPLAVLAEYAAPLLRIGGILVAWKGRRDSAEERAGAVAAAALGLAPADTVLLPPRPGAEHRTLYVYSKQLETPATYPRRPGMARKRPISG